jgi:D-alanyl-D-alanine carboxypeptidase/D-alanyl-D-alanine-endopeptidase (penicillin-binding protein 4)
VKVRPLVGVLVVGLVSALPVLAVPTAVAGSATVGLAASAATIVFGDAVTLTGAATGDPSCAAGRAVVLEWHPAGDPGFVAVATGSTAADGSFSFAHAPASTGRFRASLGASGPCLEEVSPEVNVRVRAVVDASIAASSTRVGACVELFAVVSPPKPGQSVDVQRRSAGAWTTVETVPLNGESQARAEPCLAWDDVGVARFRVRWVAQDALNETASSPTLAVEVTKARWMRRIDEAIGGAAVSVSVGEDGVDLYQRADEVPRIPASNEKLLLAMALLDAFGADHTIETVAAARSFDGAVVDGDLWILGRGDPLLGPAALADLADRLVEAGLTRIRGRVMGSTGYFRRDWDAPGWNDVARDYVNRPTALTFRGNGGRDPEREAARTLTAQLRGRGVRVPGTPGAGTPPKGLDEVAGVDSRPLSVLLAKTLRPSWNFAAEVLGKGLGAATKGAPGTIAKAAASIEAWTQARGAEFDLFDASGLSYANRVTAAGIVDLLDQAEDEDWGDDLRAALPTGGQGTLEHRLLGVRVRAKTGSLEGVSALSGWVYADRRSEWIEFSILCAGMAKSTASAIEDRIVRVLEHGAA